MFHFSGSFILFCLVIFASANKNVEFPPKMPSVLDTYLLRFCSIVFLKFFRSSDALLRCKWKPHTWYICIQNLIRFCWSLSTILFTYLSNGNISKNLLKNFEFCIFLWDIYTESNYIQWIFPMNQLWQLYSRYLIIFLLKIPRKMQ